MSFIHDDVEFGELLRIVAGKCRLAIGLVEKDYWVTHTLWALQEQGFDVWFKGGTSLSKGFGLIQRFSEDLDLKLEPGRVASVPAVSNWKSEGKKAVAERRSCFESLARALAVPGATVKLGATVDETFRSANVHVEYPGKHLAELADVFKPFVVLEVGSARVTPFVARDMSSFVHDFLEHERHVRDFSENRPKAVRCVHPFVTLLEKLDALTRRVGREHVEPATFVRHFEDAARIIAARGTLAPLDAYAGARALAEEMLAQKQIASLPSVTHAAFAPNDGERWRAVQIAHAAIAPMFWGPRVSINDSCAAIRAWIACEFG